MDSKPHHPNNVHAINGADLPPDQILRFALERRLRGVVVIGWGEEPDENGNLFYVASSYGADEKAIYALQHANQFVLDVLRHDRD